MQQMSNTSYNLWCLIEGEKYTCIYRQGIKKHINISYQYEPNLSGKPLIYFSLLFCTFSYFFQTKQKKYKKAQFSTFLDFFKGVKKVDHSSKSTSTQKVHVIKETLTDLKSIL